MSIAEKLKTARISHKLSQQTLADALGVSRTTLSEWENGKAVPPISYLRKYQDLLNLEPKYFN